MKFLQVLVMIIATVLLTNCSKPNEARVETTGVITVINNSTNPYQVFVNGKSVIASQAGKTTLAVKFTCGSVSVRVLQLSGYVLYPTDETYDGTLQCAGGVTVEYPAP